MIASETVEIPGDFSVSHHAPRPRYAIREYIGYYCVTGMAIMAAQGRSLGFSLVFATQDIPAMLRENDKEAKSIIANTTTKIFMRVEELEQTAKLAQDSGGKGMKAQVGGFSGRAGEFNTAYADNMEARLEMVDRISTLDLRALGVGEAYVTWHDQYFKVKTFHAFPEGQYGKDLPKLQLRVNHFIPVQRPNPADVKKEETLPLIAEKLADPRFAQIVEQRARDARGEIEKAVANKKDPTKQRDEIACAAIAYGRANKKTGPGGDYLTAACAAMAAITTAQANDANIFARDVRRMEGLPELPGTARSGKARVPSEVPGTVPPRDALSARQAAIEDLERSRQAAARGDARASDPMAAFTAPASRGTARPGTLPGKPVPADLRRPITDDAPPPPAMDDDDLGFETEPDFDEAAFANFGVPELPTDPERLAAQRSDAPSTMRKVDHGVTVDGRDTFKMAEKLQHNDATLRFLEALNFDAQEGAEPGVECVDAVVERAWILDQPEATLPSRAISLDLGEIERADIASAKATRWTDRVKPQELKSHKIVPNLGATVQADNVDDMTSSFLASLLNEG